LCHFLEENDVLCAEQSGFRKKHRTTDHMFILKNIIGKYKQGRKSLHIAFIDFKQAFDTIWHNGLLYKLLKYGISNKFYNIIKSMYSNIMLTIQDGTGVYMSPFFKSLVGVRQGDSLSPTLFNIFINDLPKIFNDECTPAQIGNMDISCLMYADDLIIVSETNGGLQIAMDKLGEYCKTWSLNVDINKTKYMVTKGVKENGTKLEYNNQIVEQVSNFKYLGLEFSNDGNNTIAKNELYKRGLKAYFKLISSLNPRPKPSIMLHLFDNIIKPVLLYGCEIWSPIDLTYRRNKYPLNEKASFLKEQRDKIPFITKFMNKDDPIERLHLKFCKLTLGVHSKSSNLAVYSELGRYPLFIDQLVQCMKYINYIENETKNSFLKKVYANLYENNITKNTCSLIQLKNQLAAYITIPTGNSKKPYINFKNNLMKHFEGYWSELVSTSLTVSGKEGGNKLRTYKLFKTSIGYEKYLTMNNLDKRKTITQFRISAHKLKIETGRFNNKLIYVPPELRICENCSLNKIEDEFHFLLECPLYEDLRVKLFTSISGNNKYFCQYSHGQKFIWIMTTEEVNDLNQLGDFLCDAFRVRTETQNQGTMTMYK